MVVKEIKLRKNVSVARLKMEASHEARIIQRLEDYPGINNNNSLLKHLIGNFTNKI